MTVQKTSGSWELVERNPWDDEFVVVGCGGGDGEVIALGEDDEVALVIQQSEPEELPKAAEVSAAEEPPIESMKLILKGRTVIFYGMTKEERLKEFEDGCESLLEPVVQDDKIVCWSLKADKIPRLQQLIGYYREESQKRLKLDAVAYAEEIAKLFSEPRDYLLEADFLPKLVALTKGSKNPCLYFEVIERLSRYLHYADLTCADVFCESEDEPLLAPPPAWVVETSLPEAIIEFLETEKEPKFLPPGKEVFEKVLALFKPLKAQLLQVCTVDLLSEYLDEVDKNPEFPCPFQIPAAAQTELTAFLALYIQHGFTPLCTEEEPPSLIEIRARSLQQLRENALAALEEVVHAANFNITFDSVNGEVRLEKNHID